MEHVDVVVTDWAAGIETRVATYTLIGSAVKCQVRDGDYEHLEGLEIPLPNGTVVTSANGVAYLHALGPALSSSYVSVVPLHDEDACLFRSTDVIDISEAATV